MSMKDASLRVLTHWFGMPVMTHRDWCVVLNLKPSIAIWDVVANQDLHGWHFLD